jgi:hypothetical protein
MSLEPVLNRMVHMGRASGVGVDVRIGVGAWPGARVRRSQRVDWEVVRRKEWAMGWGFGFSWTRDQAGKPELFRCSASLGSIVVERHIQETKKAEGTEEGRLKWKFQLSTMKSSICWVFTREARRCCLLRNRCATEAWNLLYFCGLPHQLCRAQYQVLEETMVGLLGKQINSRIHILYFIPYHVTSNFLIILRMGSLSGWLWLNSALWSSPGICKDKSLSWFYILILLCKLHFVTHVTSVINWVSSFLKNGFGKQDEYENCYVVLLGSLLEIILIFGHLIDHRPRMETFTYFKINVKFFISNQVNRFNSNIPAVCVLPFLRIRSTP